MIQSIVRSDSELQASEVLTAIGYYNSGKIILGTDGKQITVEQVLQTIAAYNSQDN